MTKKEVTMHVHNPMGRERQVDPKKAIRIEIDGSIYTVRVDTKTRGIRINKFGGGSVRGEVDRITILPTTNYEFIIR